jgi:hypothetical protein
MNDLQFHSINMSMVGLFLCTIVYNALCTLIVISEIDKLRDEIRDKKS